jgi:ATP-dependent DNA helicase RecG
MAFIRQKLREGRQAYFVYPLVDESDKIALQSAIKAHQELTGVFKEFRVGLLHGRMKAEEKDAVMEEFRAGRIHALVSTLVVEVGIDVPNASIMVIDHCERYGLSQLHQLRGRIGRGVRVELHPLRQEQRADRDVRLDDGRVPDRGGRPAAPGTGRAVSTRQSGLPELRRARPVEDAKLWSRRARTRFALVARDPSSPPPRSSGTSWRGAGPPPCCTSASRP